MKRRHVEFSSHTANLALLRNCVRDFLDGYPFSVPHEMKGRSHDMIKPGGLGLFLIRKAFDEVDYIHKRRGTELVLTKNLE